MSLSQLLSIHQMSLSQLLSIHQMSLSQLLSILNSSNHHMSLSQLLFILNSSNHHMSLSQLLFILNSSIHQMQTACTRTQYYHPTMAYIKLICRTKVVQYTSNVGMSIGRKTFGFVSLHLTCKIGSSISCPVSQHTKKKPKSTKQVLKLRNQVCKEEKFSMPTMKRHPILVLL
jgi:hypothetical protein